MVTPKRGYNDDVMEGAGTEEGDFSTHNAVCVRMTCNSLVSIDLEENITIKGTVFRGTEGL